MSKHPFYFLFFFSLVLMGLSYAPMDYYYEVESSGKIAFDGKLLKNVDFKSFKVLYPSDYFAVDNKNLFFKRYKVPNVNRTGFQAYSNYLGSDGKNTVLMNDFSEDRYSLINTVNFSQISNHYYRDNKKIYFLRASSAAKSKAELILLKNVDAESFRLIYEEKRSIDDPGLILARDKNSLYLREKSVFSSIGKKDVRLLLKSPAFGAYVQVGGSVIYVNRSNYQKVEVQSPSSLEYINNHFISDGFNLYRASNPVDLKYKGNKNIRSNQLKIYEEVWGVFKDSLYYLRGNTIKEFTDINADKFEVLRNYCKHGIGCIDLAQDSKRFFYRDRAFSKENLDENIKYVLNKYPDYRNAVFYPGSETLVREAEQSSFVALEDFYGKDSKQFYYFDSPIASPVDRETFKVLSDGYAKDAKSVFYKGKILKHAHAATFKRVPGKFSDRSISVKKIWKDKSNSYDKNGEPL